MTESKIPRIRQVTATDRPEVSVVTATYNAVSDLRHTVDTVSEQSFGSLEHIVIDGGSNDGTVEFLAGLEDRVRYISEPDGGIADAMNKGIAMARGHWIIVLHAGDLFETPHSLSNAWEKMKHEIDVNCFAIRFGDDRNSKIIHQTAPQKRLEFKPIAHQGVVCRRSVFESFGGFLSEFQICMDYEFFLRLLRGGCTFQTVPIVLTIMDDDGLSSRQDWKSLSERFSEERRVQLLHCPSEMRRLVYRAYWPPYRLYRFILSMMRQT